MKGFGKITIQNIYKGIDWVIYTDLGSKNNPLKCDFVVHPGADYRDIRINYSNAKSVNLSKDKSSLKIKTIAGSIEEGKLFSYIQEDGEKLEKESKYMLDKDKSVSFEIANCDITQTMIIDPMVWATYYGGNTADGFTSIAIDSHDDIYVCGYTYSTDFPTLQMGGAYNQSTYVGNWDAIILKFSSQGVRQWSTYYGGTNMNEINSIAIDRQDHIYIAGRTQSADFPTQQLAGAYWQSAFAAGGYDNFIMKFTIQGVRQWATFYGGNGNEDKLFIKTEHEGNIYATGSTNAPDFPVLSLAGAYWQPNKAGEWDAFILKFNNQDSCVWSTFYGGAVDDKGKAVCIDNQNNFYISGITLSANMPLQQLPGAYFQANNAGLSDAFIAKFDSMGVFVWGTYYGGSDNDYTYSLDHDSQDNLFMTGSTKSINFPTQSLAGVYWQANNAGLYDAYILKFNKQNMTQWATYFGGSNAEDDFMNGYYLKVDHHDNIYVTGCTMSTNFPTVQFPGNYWQANNAGFRDAVMAKFNPQCMLQWATYYGTGDTDFGTDIAFDSQNSTYFIGEWPGPNAFTLDEGNGAYYDSNNNGGDDSYIVKFSCNVQNPSSIKTDRNNLCMYDNGNITLTAIGGSGDSLKWYRGACGENYIGSGNNFTLPSPTLTTTYYARWESPCDTSDCASVVVYIDSVFYKILNPIICQGQSFAVGIHQYYNTGTYYDTLATLSGCDSIVTTNLTVNPTPPTPVVTQNGNTLSSSATAGNQWYNQNGAISGAVNQTYTYLTNGNYYLIVTLNGCSSDTSNIIHVSNVGLDNFDKPNAFNAYPNPVTNELIIEISGNRDEIGFEIYNSIGQLMFEDKMKEKTKISTANFVAGMYLIKLENGKKFEFKKIIKEN
ncbi:MAG: SBBP repeat-containing protein [Bacteroidota bacterium]